MEIIRIIDKANSIVLSCIYLRICQHKVLFSEMIGFFMRDLVSDETDFDMFSFYGMG